MKSCIIVNLLNNKIKYDREIVKNVVNLTFKIDYVIISIKLFTKLIVRTIEMKETKKRWKSLDPRL